jgi:mono/diheme cytochrome c family protein
MRKLSRRRSDTAAFVTVVFQLTLSCYGAGVSRSNDISASTPVALQNNQVRSIILPHFEPDLAIAAGRDEFMVVCVSCHSPRYVTMQPPFSQRQWEETVDKMSKVYGAQMDQEQRQSIIGYLVATHGPSANTEPPLPGDDEPDFSTKANPPAPAETAPLLKLAVDAKEHATELTHGADLYRQNCAGCHGTTGRGDGLVSRVLLRQPKNLAAIRFSVQLLSQVLWNGKRGTAMPSWRGMPRSDLAALAAYVESLNLPVKPDEGSPEQLQLGNKLFQQNCAPCHGVSGDAKSALSATLIPEPANLKLKQPDFDYIWQVVRDGIPGTAMPAWANQLSDSDRRALATFVRSLFEGDAPKAH